MPRGVFWAFVAICGALSFADFQCSSRCDVGAGLHCSVKATDVDCLSTAFTNSHNWPGKPEQLAIQSYPLQGTHNPGFVGVNITWRTPSDISATYVKGFEVSLNLIGSEVFGIRNCYVFNLSRKANQSRVFLQELVDSVFNLQCQVPAKAEGVLTNLYSLPKPKKKLLQKRVHKYFRLEAMTTTASADICDEDPRITTSMDRYQAQIIVKLGNWHGYSKYIIRLMKGSYVFDQQIIQPGNGSGIQQATFGNPKNIQPGECYSIWVNMESCENFWGAWLTNNLCVSEKLSPSTPLTETTVGSNKDPVPLQPGLSPTVVAVLVIVVVLILCLVFIAVYKWIQFEPHPFPWIKYSQPGPEKSKTLEDPEIPWPDYPHDKISKLVFFYCLSPANKNCVEEFKKVLNMACEEAIEFIDFVNQEEIDRNTGNWITELVRKIDETGCHLLVIYSSGLACLFEAEHNGKCYPDYINKEHNGEYVISFFKKIRDDLLLYNSHRGKELVVSLGSRYTNSIAVTRALANFSGCKPMLLSDNNGRVSINMPEMCRFLERLGVTAPKEALKRIDTEALKKAVEKMLLVEKDPNWFKKTYGDPQMKNMPSKPCLEKRYSLSSDSSASHRGSQGCSSSGFATVSLGETDLLSPYHAHSCHPAHWQPLPPELLDEDNVPGLNQL